LKTSNKELNQVQISAGKYTLYGNLEIPEDSRTIVMFAHGSGSGRFSPRNNYVASMMNKQGIATLLMDLLTMEEEAVDISTAEFRFDIDLLANRLVDSTRWLKNDSDAKSLSVGYFGSSTGAAAALIAAAKLPKEIKAVVSRGGRPDLASDFLADVEAPTLLIVGGNDFEVLEMNRQALELIRVEKKLEVVFGATHLFEEPGKLQEAAELAIDWFKKYL
jgi:dienelactone hydrolase